MSHSLSKRRGDYLLELNPCPGFAAQRIKLWQDDFSGQFYPSQPGYYGKRMKRNYSLHFILEGEGFFALEDEIPGQLGRGDIFYIKKNQLVRYYPDDKKPWKYCGISFDSPEIGEFFEGIGWKSSFVLRRDGVTDRIGAVLCETVEKKEEGEVGSYDILACACRIFSLLENHYAGKIPAVSAARRYVDRAKEVMEIGYSDPELRITGVAAAVNLSHPYLCRVFKKLEGCSPEQYLLRYRMSVAKRLLRAGGYSVGEVAFLCGYTDAAQFSRMYKKRYGVAPSKE